MPLEHAEADVAFYVSRFVDGWYRGHAHLLRDVERFTTTYRIPTPQRQPFRLAVMRTLPEPAFPAATLATATRAASGTAPRVRTWPVPWGARLRTAG
jgi:hypothetical protein